MDGAVFVFVESIDVGFVIGFWVLVVVLVYGIYVYFDVCLVSVVALVSAVVRVDIFVIDDGTFDVVAAVGFEARCSVLGLLYYWLFCN